MVSYLSGGGGVTYPIFGPYFLNEFVLYFSKLAWSKINLSLNRKDSWLSGSWDLEGYTESLTSYLFYICKEEYSLKVFFSTFLYKLFVKKYDDAIYITTDQFLNPGELLKGSTLMLVKRLCILQFPSQLQIRFISAG